MKLSVIVPIYNEAAGLAAFNDSLVKVLADCVGDDYEIIYCNDGSSDGTPDLIKKWHAKNSKIKLLSLSRNFGKESCLSAGIAAANGQAVLMLDGDGQHPVELIPDFVKAWETGAQVVIGVRSEDGHSSWLKRRTSAWFYKTFNRMSSQQLVPGSTDFRLIDAEVRKHFVQLPENDRITRGLIDWLGFERAYIKFKPKARSDGQATYDRRKLRQLAINSFVSLTPTPLYLFGYLGLAITTFSFLLGCAVIVEQLILNDPLNWNFTGAAMLGILILFLVGILLMAQGILSLYIAHIHRQSMQRPLYVIDRTRSAGITDNKN